MNTDRITRAWLTRCAIHAWIAQNPTCTMRAVQDHFYDINIETVRKAVYQMRADGDIAMDGGCGGRAGKLSVITASIRSEAEKRERLSTSKLDQTIEQKRAEIAALFKAKRKAQRAAEYAARKMQKLAAKEKEEDESIGTITIAPGHIRHSNARGRPIKDQGGQGAARARVYVNSFHLF